MSRYIQDNNNMESITNDVTVLNATNVKNLTYKVDEIQLITNALKDYKHTTIISSSKETWANKSWLDTDSGTVGTDIVNYILNGKTIEFTGSAEDDGIHIETNLDLTAHSDGYTSGDDELITFYIYISSADLADLTAGGHTAQLRIGFYTDVYGTVTNYYSHRFDDLLAAGNNFIKLKKSDFGSAGAPSWASIKGIDFYLSNDDPNAEVNFSIDAIMLQGVEFKNFIQKSATESVTSSTAIQDDDDFNVTFPANGIFEVEILLACSGATSGDIDIAWAVSGGVAQATTRKCVGPAPATSGADNTNMRATSHNLTTEVWYGCDGSNAGVINEHFIVETSGGSGTLKMQWAQHASSGTATTLSTNSYMKITQIQ